MTTTRLRGVAALALVGVCALSACGSDDDGGSGRGEPTGAAATRDTDPSLAFAQCLRENGADVKDPQPGQPVLIDPSMDQSALEAAREACADLVPEGVRGEGGPGGGFPDLDQLLALAACMREKGIEDVPDPQQGPGGEITQPLGGSFDPGDPEVVAAREACSAELGVELPGGGPR